MDKKKIVVPLSALALVLSAGGGIVAAAHADTSAAATTSTSTTSQDQADHGERQKPAAVGTVTAISGSSITLEDTQSGTTYTVDASSATIKKHETPATEGEKPTSTTITVSGIAVGDTLMVQGTVSGSSITATQIHDGKMGMGGHGFGGHGGPDVRGTITAVNGTTLTVKGADGTTYTVNATDAKASKMTTMSVSDVQVGDSVGIDGTVSGTSVTAKRVMDGIPAEPTQSSTSS